MQIKSLEADVGATLLDRRYHRVELTEAGEALLPHARDVLADIAAARDDIEGLSNTLTGHLVIASSTTPGDYVIPKHLAEFLRQNPQVQVEITVQDSAEAVTAVETGRADLGITGAADPSAKVVFTELGCDEIVVICSPSHPFASQSAVPFSELAEADWVSREAGSGTGQVVRRSLAERGVDPDELRVIVELGTGDAIVSAVEGGLGIAMVSRFAAEKALALGTVVRVAVEGEPILRPFFTALPTSTPSRAALAFAEHLAGALASQAGR
jgi:DNA-binding transcriptional LysR family regulator